MKRKLLSALSIFLILALFFFVSWLHVDGDEISCLQAVSEQYTGSAEKTNISVNNYAPVTRTFTEDQIIQLKDLLLSSRFRRNLSHSYTYKGMRDTYSLVLECADSQGKQVAFIPIYIVEDLYVSITAPYTDERFTLKILDNQFCDELNHILFGPYPFE